MPSRRSFIAALAAATAARGLAAPPAAVPKTQPKPARKIDPPAEAKGLSAYQYGPEVWLRWDNQVLTSYRAHPTQKYPYFYPVVGPVTGLPLTSETSVPYPHHRSLFMACDKVNKANYWQTELAGGQIISRGPKFLNLTAQSVEIVDECDWRQSGKPIVMSDKRRFVVSVRPRLTLIDAEIVWQAVEDVVIERTNHALYSVRAAADIIPWNGGTLLSSTGAKGEEQTFGKPAAWLCYFGKRRGDGPVEGIALMDHPKNPWAPTPWFTRDYGFISPMPFNFMEKSWELPAGKSVSLAYRVAAFAGTPDEAGIARLYAEWAGAQ